MSNVSAVMRCADGLATVFRPSSMQLKTQMQDKVALSAVRTVAVSGTRSQIVRSSKTRNEDRWARCAPAWLAEEAATENASIRWHSLLDVYSHLSNHTTFQGYLHQGHTKTTGERAKIRLCEVRALSSASEQCLQSTNGKP